MILHEPFIIGPNLRPALKVGNGILSLASAAWSDEGSSILGKRMEFGFYLDTPDFEYFDDRMQSGCGGYGLVEAFEDFLGFLEAAVESYRYEQRYPGAKGENTDLFPPHVVEWAATQTCLEETRNSICDEDGDVLHHLIKE